MISEVNIANPQVENGHLDLANEIVEAMARTQLSGYESRILWVVWRRTYCWHKKSEIIKFDMFRSATGLFDSHISRTIKKLVNRNILTKNGNSYSFQKDYQKWQVELPKMVSTVTKNGKSTYQKSASVASPKETIKRNLLKETIKRKELLTQEERKNVSFLLVEKGMDTTLVENELSKFISYWTELNHAGTKQRWQMEKTFEVNKRLTNWFNNISKFGGQSGKSRLGRI